MNVSNYPLFVNQPMNANAESIAIGLPNIIGYAIQAEIAGSDINGFIKIQVSCDPAPQNRQNNIMPTNWTDIPCSQLTLITSGDITWNVLDTFYTWFRLVYIDNSGGTSDGTLSAISCIKGV